LKAVFNNPLFLLNATGTLFGLHFSLDKVVGEIGMLTVTVLLNE